MEEKSILLADDLANRSNVGRSRSHLIRDLAAELSRRLNLSLQVLYVSPLQKSLSTKALRQTVKENDRESIKLLGNEMSHYPVQTKIISTEGEPVSRILKQEENSAPLEMIVLGSQGKKGLKKALIGSVSEEVLRNSEIPVLILGPNARSNKFELPMEEPLRILLLTDLSSASVPAEEYAISLASRLKATLTFCYSVGHEINQVKELMHSRKVGNLTLRALFKDIRQKGELALRKKTLDAEKRNIDAKSLFLKEEVKLEDILPDKVGDAYDLIVMGTHSRNKLLTAFIGSSARNLILKAPVPVLICRSHVH